MKSMRLAACGAALAMTASVLLAASPANAESDLRAELGAIAAATSAASATGFSITMYRSGEVSTLGVVGSGLNAENPEVTVTWGHRGGAWWEVDTPTGDGGTSYMTYDWWRTYSGMPNRVLGVVDRTITNLGGSRDSLLPILEFDAQEWQQHERAVVFNELGAMAAGILADEDLIELAKTETSDATVYSVVTASGETGAFVVRNGLIDEMVDAKGGEKWVTTARGAGVIVPSETGNILETDTVQRAGLYYSSLVIARSIAEGAATVATARAAVKGTKVSLKMIARALKASTDWAGDQWRWSKAGKGYRLSPVQEFPEFGKVCLTLSPAGKRVVVKSC